MLVECPECEARVKVEVLKDYGVFGESDDIATVYSFAKCPQCAGPLLVRQYDYGGWLDDPVRLYPPRDERISPSIPNQIAVAYVEARACLRAKAFTAAAIMCRKALQGICDSHGIKKRNLNKALIELRDQGIIEPRLYEWADTLRLSGNAAAHDVKVTISREDAVDIMEFTHALLEYLYTFRERFEAFKSRRSKPKKTVDDILVDLEGDHTQSTSTDQSGASSEEAGVSGEATSPK